MRAQINEPLISPKSRECPRVVHLLHERQMTQKNGDSTRDDTTIENWPRKQIAEIYFASVEGREYVR
jgi:hypothetical protein